jgi:hypothetical protein
MGLVEMMAIDFPDLGVLQERLAVMLLHCPRPLSTREAYDRLADEFELTRELLRRELENGDSQWHILVRTAYKHLKDQGYAPKPPPIGKWRLNQAGRAYAEKIEKRPS